MAHNGGVKRDIPIKLGDFSVIDSEFSNIRERFDAEMRKMEDEMTKFRSELMNRESNFFKTTSKLVSFRVHVGTHPPIYLIKNYNNNMVTLGRITARKYI